VPPALAALVGRAGETWSGLGSRTRAWLVVAAVVAGLAGLGVYAAGTLLVDYQVLFANLSNEDAGAVVEALKAGRVPYRVTDGGQVLVPAARVHEWRLKLATQGVPSGGHVGFEIFDKNQFGLTDFAQRLNFQRALQGELARTIGQLKEVQQARVHLALPAPRVFSSQERPASASVVLRLRPGTMLRGDQVRGIVHLVTSSVEGLSPDRVTVVDSTGRMLMSGLDRVGGLSANQVEARATIEQDIERRIQSLLDPIVGPGHSAVRVAATVNFDQIERTEERFDPKPLIRTQTKSTEQMQGSSAQPTVGPQGAPQTQAPATATNRTQRDSEQTTYEIARTVERTVVAPGNIRQLSVAVLLDVPLVNGTRAPRPDEDIERVKRLVASAAGIRADRKDELEIAQVPFDPSVGVPGEAAPTAPREAPVVAAPRIPWLWVVTGVAVLVAVLVFVAIMSRARRRRRALESAVGAAFDGDHVLPETKTPAAAPAAVTGPPSAAAAQRVIAASLPDIDLIPEDDPLKRQVLKVAREHPDEVAQLVRAWMFRRKAVAS
jgi:flagellar M-ring protein FliF